MKMPNQRYGDRDEFIFYAHWHKPKDLARLLRRSERSVRDWLSGREPVPWWIPELLRLREVERRETLRQMGITRLPNHLGIVAGSVIRFPRLDPKPEKSPATAPGDRQQEAL
ncbi:hypothetical protein [Herbaspirillum huttiense]|uniref:hypothetical protein n=1 Tax=Herbaspirillum huttiense TaxID=863372 RepID=UPI0031D35D60